MNTEITYKIIGLIVMLNIANRLYFNFGNHGWSKSGYDSYSYLGGITYFVNFISGIMVAVWLLVLYFKW